MWFTSETKPFTAEKYCEHVKHAKSKSLATRRFVPINSQPVSFQNGMPGSGNFTHGDMCKITNYRVPCHFVKDVDRYHTKAFISVFSDDGSKLLTVSQGS